MRNRGFRAMPLPNLSGQNRGQPNANSKFGSYSTDPNIATAPEPASQVGHAEFRYRTYTYLTTAAATGTESPVLYNGDRLWALVTLTLETAGPVAVGDAAQLLPVLSGRGRLLQTGVPTQFKIGKGDKLYIAATAVNRVAVLIEAVPWLETITGLLGGGGGARHLARAAADVIRNPFARKPSKIY